ncbi:hypothetical protein SAMN05421545_1714 [Pontibacter lucknowensis]|uniref:Uncharacterized protein n=1 Tax=Pontibacter lucknowensis TaxID=1077936 RepID=A0A1N6WRF0_9BACT|nr:hypothetical protein SAMN05421545_1714 [Pontibacter lucknowensis]
MLGYASPSGCTSTFPKNPSNTKPYEAKTLSHSHRFSGNLLQYIQKYRIHFKYYLR